MYITDIYSPISSKMPSLVNVQLTRMCYVRVKAQTAAKDLKKAAKVIQSAAYTAARVPSKRALPERPDRGKLKTSAREVRPVLGSGGRKVL